jgi:endonuclease YncB( thermonuclease family)
MSHPRRRLPFPHITARILTGVLAGILAGILAGLALSAAPTDDELLPPSELFKITKVVDGDTIHIHRNGGTQKLRLLSVDTEEKLSGRARSGGSKPETVFGEEAKLWAQAFFKKLEEDGVARIGLRFPEGREENDVYGRVLCHVLLPDGSDFNLLLVREGWSPYFNKYGNSRICHEAFLEAQEQARAAKLGIWNPETNQAKTPGAPEVKRPYGKLMPWWNARAEAIDAFRARRAADPASFIDAEDPIGLEAAREKCRTEPAARVEIFGSIYRIFDEKNGDRTVLFRSSHHDDALRIRIPADEWESFASLDLEGTTKEFRQNFLCVRGVITRGPRGFRMTTREPAAWRIAEPEYPETDPDAPADPDSPESPDSPGADDR